MKLSIASICLLACMLLLYQQAYTQTTRSVTIKGIITNQSGEPLSGVTVEIKGSSLSKTVLTQGDGSFQIEAHAGLLGTDLRHIRGETVFG